AVDPAQLRLLGMDDLPAGLDGGLDLTPQGDQAIEVRRPHGYAQARAVDDGVEGATEGDGGLQPPGRRRDGNALFEHEAGDVAKANPPDPPVHQVDRGLDPARGDVDRHARARLVEAHQAGVDGPGHQGDRPVPAGRAVAGVVEED